MKRRLRLIKSKQSSRGCGTDISTERMQEKDVTAVVCGHMGGPIRCPLCSTTITIHCTNSKLTIYTPTSRAHSSLKIQDLIIQQGCERRLTHHTSCFDYPVIHVTRGRGSWSTALGTPEWSLHACKEGCKARLPIVLLPTAPFAAHAGQATRGTQPATTAPCAGPSRSPPCPGPPPRHWHTQS